jgi:hypothetical protein
MTQVALRVENAGTYGDVVQSKLAFCRIEDGVVVVRSQLAETEPLNEHLVWLWGIVKHERRVLQSAVAAGARIICECTVPKGKVCLRANGAELIHLLGAELVLNAK